MGLGLPPEVPLRVVCDPGSPCYAWARAQALPVLVGESTRALKPWLSAVYLAMADTPLEEAEEPAPALPAPEAPAPELTLRDDAAALAPSVAALARAGYDMTNLLDSLPG